MAAWDPLVQSTDFVLLAGKQTPGIAEIVDPRTERRWEEIVGPGFSGGFSIYRGEKLRRFKIKIQLVEAKHWDEWEAFISVLGPPVQGPNSKALAVWHPLLVTHQIKGCEVVSWSGPTEQDLGIWQVEIECLEFRAPKKSLTKPIAESATREAPQSAAEAAFFAAGEEDAQKARELLK